MEKGAAITNRAARRDYSILETVEAGLKLIGAEVKSLRDGRGSLAESFARVDKGELYLYHMHIPPYEHTSLKEQDSLRPKKLLLHKKQITYLVSAVSHQSLALIPLKVYFKNGFAKVELGLAKGRKQYDKREAIRLKEAQREMDRARSYKG